MVTLGIVLDLIVLTIIARWALEEKWLLKIESAMVGSVRTVCVQEGVFKEQKEVDQDTDGTGEYGRPGISRLRMSGSGGLPI
jgi:hypothetical protein